MSPNPLPLFLELAGRRVLVVGGGSVAAAKIRSLLGAGADVHVVARHAQEDVRALASSGHIALDVRAFQTDDVAGAWLVISATNDPDVNRAVAGAAARARVFVCAVDDVANTSACFGSILDRPPFLIAISSRGEAPALTRLLREILEEVLPASRWVEAARELRRSWKANARPMGERFPELVRMIADDL